MLQKKTYSDILVRAMEQLQEDGNVTNFNPGAVARTLLEIQATELGTFYDVMELNVAMKYVSTAAGVYLDLIGDLMSVSRGNETRAVVSREDANIRFRTDDNTPLAAVLPGNVIPVGTKVTTSDGSISYTVTEDVPVNDVQSSAYVGALSDESGPDYNVGVGMLTVHTLGIANLSCTNTKDIGSGTEVESDSNYRYRIASSMQGYARANATAVRLAALSIPGVSDVVVTDVKSGVGTFDILVIPVGNVVSNEALRAVRTAIGFTKAAGVIGTVRQPSYVPVELIVRLSYTSGTPDSDKTEINRSVVTAILGYIGEITLGGTFVLNEFRQRVMETSDRIFDMETLCYIFRRRPQLLRNFRLDFDELLLPDPQAAEPIKVLTK